MTDQADAAMRAFSEMTAEAKSPFRDHECWQLSQFDHQKIWQVHEIAQSWVRYATKADHYLLIGRTLAALERICNTLQGPEHPVVLSVDLRHLDWDVGCRICIFTDYIELRRHDWMPGNTDCPEDDDRPIFLSKTGGYQEFFGRPSPGFYDWDHAWSDFVDQSKFEGIPPEEVILSDLPEVNFS